MKTLKQIALTVALTLITLLTMVATTKAATVKVTADTLNIRKSPSTSSNVIAMLSKDVECELLEESGDWYKVKYKNYTGYVSKQYVKVIGEVPSNKDENTENTNTEQNNTTNEEPTVDTNQNEQNQNNEQTTATVTYKKLKEKTDLKILPLIHSSVIKSVKSGTQAILITEVSGWSYIELDTVSGWIRSSTLTDSEKSSNNSSLAPTNEKKLYVSEGYVNLRKGAGTSYSIIKVLGLNAELTLIEKDGDWYKVKSGSDTGYILKDFISETKVVTSRSNLHARVEEDEIDETIEKLLKEETKATNTSKKETSNQTTTGSSKTETTSSKEVTSKKEETTNKTSTNTTKTETTKTKGTDIIAYAENYLGHKYVYGGDGSNGTFDCSGFTMYVFKHFGISLPHGATSQYKSGKGTKITKQSDLKTGDIVFLTDYETGKGIGHCGIYIGDGNFIHASTTTYTVTISSLNTMYKGRFYAGLRLI